MKILVEELIGDASVMFYNKNGELIHTEGFYSKDMSHYIRDIPVSEIEYSYTRALFDQLFKYRVVL